MALNVPKGITPNSVTHIPDQWDANWFRQFIKNHLQYADVRNAIPGSGIAIAGNPTTFATLSGGGGALNPHTVTNNILVQGPPLTVKGNATGITADEQDIAASGPYQTLQVNSAGTGLVWASPFTSGTQVRGTTWSGGNAAILVANQNDVSIIIPQDSLITRCTVLTKGGVGNCEIDIWSSPVAAYPPTVANSICSANHPIISGGTYRDDTTLTGFNTTLPAGNVVTFHLVSCTVFTEITIMLALSPTVTNTPNGYTNAQAIAAVAAALANTGNVYFTYSGGAISANTAGATTTTWAQSLGNNGYQRLPSGLIIQWGRFTLPSAAGQNITFPITFPNNVFSCVPSQGDSTGYGYPFGVDSLSTSGFSVVNSAGGINGGTGYYIAIGN